MLYLLSRRGARLSLFASYFLFASIAVAQRGTPILPTDLFSTYQVYGADSLTIVPVNDSSVPFTQAFRVGRNSVGQASYSAAIYWNTTAEVPQNDLLVATFWIKNLNPDLAVLSVSPIFQDQKTYSKALEGSAPSDQAEWVKYAIPFRANQIFGAGTASSFQFFFGSAIQTFEVGGISVEDYGVVPDPIPASLSDTFAYYYPTRYDPNAPWRKLARQNIRKTRMAELIVKVTQNGKFVRNADIYVNQVRSAFGWGSALNPCSLLGTCLSASDTQQYTDAVQKNFTIAGFENAFKWPSWECCSADALNGLSWLQQHNIPLRGHNLIWPNFSTMPSDTANLSPPALAARIDNHFYDEEGTLKGKIFEWDVVNEPYTSNQVQGLIPGVPNVTPSQGVLGNSAIVDWFKLAAQIDNQTHLYLNDYNIFENKDPVHEAYDLALVKYLQDGGAKVQGLGFQAHFNQTAPYFPALQATINDFDPYISEYGVTEFDFTTIDPKLQADLTRDFMTFIFGQPKFHEFVMWGFWEGQHWLNNAPLYYLDWTLKPSGQVWQELTLKQWQTHKIGSSNSRGQYSTRAYKGTYNITVAKGPRTCSKTVELTENAVVDVPLDCR